MPGLTDKAAGSADEIGRSIEEAQRAWQKSMQRQIEALRQSLRTHAPDLISHRSGAEFDGSHLTLSYWFRKMRLSWPALEASHADGKPCSTFDLGMLLYYLHTADGAPLADRWISYRELPGGAFYNRAFQGYSGDLLARSFAASSQAFDQAAREWHGWPLPALAEHAYAFQPLPCIRLAAVLWPGDEDFPTKASILFDAASHHYMTTDGLALLGSGLAGRLRKAARS
jgi:hypothetical protein